MEEERDSEGDECEEGHCEELEKVSVGRLRDLDDIDIRPEMSMGSCSCHA